MKTALIAGASLLTVLVGFTYYKNTYGRKYVKPEREKLLKMLLGMREAMYPCLLEIVHIIQSQVQGRQLRQPAAIEQLKNMIMSQQCPTGVKIKKMMSEFHQFISQQDFQKALQQDYKDDAELQFHKKAFQEEFNKAFLGVQPSLKTQIPVFMTEEKILKVVSSILNEKLNRLKIYSELNEQLNEQFLKKDAEVDTHIRNKHFKSFGFKQIKDIDYVFQFCVAKYKKISPKFNEEYQKIIVSYKNQLKLYIKEDF